MKSQEELVDQISKLQCMVGELKMGFSSALMELGHIQHGDSFLREEMEENRRRCQKKARHLESLVDALREELSEVRGHMVQLHGDLRVRAQQDQDQNQDQDREKPRPSDGAEPVGGAHGASPCVCRGKLLLHCFLQGLKSALSEGTDARHQVALQLLHSEWEYVSTLNQLYDNYHNTHTHVNSEAMVMFVDRLLQRHLLFRNSLQERLSAEHWKSLLGDVLLQLIGHNDTSFADTYLGYTRGLASVLHMELSGLGGLRGPGPSTGARKAPREREEVRLLSLLLAPVSRVHGYLSHIQNLLQWTSKEHPDCSLLLGAERSLRDVLSRCHVILEDDVCWEESGGESSSCSDATGCPPSDGGCVTTRVGRGEASTADHRVSGAGVRLPEGGDSLGAESWSCSPVKRRTCGHACCPSLLRPPHRPPPVWGDTSDSGRGTFTHLTAKSSTQGGASLTHGPPDGSQSDQDNTSAFDYSSVTSCSPDGTLHREGGAEEEQEEEPEEEEPEEEEDSQVPVLLRPSDSHREGSVCLRWQIPRLTPHPPLRSAADPPDPPPQHPISSRGRRLVSVRRGSPPLHPNSAFRPIWDEPCTQAEPTLEQDTRRGFKPVRAGGSRPPHRFNRSRESVGTSRGTQPAVGLWGDSEDSEGPCSTV